MMRIHLDPPSSRTADEISVLVAAELDAIEDPRVADALRRFLIVPPRMEMRDWEWFRPISTFPTWVVAESARYDYGLVYSDYGFGPDHPWGLIFSSQSTFGADYCWYRRLSEAFLDSRLIEEFDPVTEKDLRNAARTALRAEIKP